MDKSLILIQVYLSVSAVYKRQRESDVEKTTRGGKLQKKSRFLLVG